VKNALEATPEFDTVTIGAKDHGTKITFFVNNPGVMSEEVRYQIFQRYFSTKQGEGRGIGTYSVKLFTERYLGGKAEFTSREPEGTTFYVILPKALSANQPQ
jgi:signal transduction histidine kinase